MSKFQVQTSRNGQCSEILNHSFTEPVKECRQMFSIADKERHRLCSSEKWSSSSEGDSMILTGAVSLSIFSRFTFNCFTSNIYNIDITFCNIDLQAQRKWLQYCHTHSHKVVHLDYSRTVVVENSHHLLSCIFKPRSSSVKRLTKKIKDYSMNNSNQQPLLHFRCQRKTELEPHLS